MDRLWAPWRMTYLKSDPPKGCIFCVNPRRGNDRADLILHRGKTVFVMMNLYPYCNGHLLVSPYRHVASFENLSPPTLSDLMVTAQQAIGALRNVFNPDAFNLGINQGREAGAGIESHVHLHIVPRWNGDTNFMPVLTDTRVIPENLDSSYARLRPFFQSSVRKTRAPRSSNRTPRTKRRK